MALAGTGQTAATLVKAAKDAVKAEWLAKNRVLSAGEIEQMQIEVEAAGFNALFTHIASAGVVVLPALGLVAPPGGGPVTGVAAGTIT